MTPGRVVSAGSRPRPRRLIAQQTAQQLQGGRGTPALLDHQIQHLAFVIDSAPELRVTSGLEAVSLERKGSHETKSHRPLRQPSVETCSRWTDSTGSLFSPCDDDVRSRREAQR